MKVWVLGSGSSGNAVLVESGESRVLVDAGFGTRTWKGERFTRRSSSDSATPSDNPPAFIVTSGRAARSDSRCSRLATTSLPVPCSPVINTDASDGATRSIVARTAFIDGASAMNVGRSRRCSRVFSSCRRRLRRNARRSSSCVCTATSSLSSSHGFSM